MDHECRYRYAENLLRRWPDLARRFAAGTVVPDQIEVQLPPRGRRLCWLACPFCYRETGRHADCPLLSASRAVELIEEIGEGHPRTGERPCRIVFSGVSTDPLNSRCIDSSVGAVRRCGLGLGIHTRMINLSNELIGQVVQAKRGDYVSISLDAGTDAVFNRCHGVRGGGPVLSRILGNVERLTRARDETALPLTIIGTYLLLDGNTDPAEIRTFARVLLGDIGFDLVRFSEPYVPNRFATGAEFPSAGADHLARARECIAALQEEYGGKVTLLEFTRHDRCLPCVTRWLQPVIGYDGYLYPCSQTSVPDFAELRVGDLATSGFWEAYSRVRSLDPGRAACLCDRKGFEINSALAELLAA